MKIAHTLKLAAAIALISAVALPAAAQQRKLKYIDGQWLEVIEEDSDDPNAVEFTELIDTDSIPTIIILPADTTIDVSSRVFPPYYYTPMIFDYYDVKVAPDSIFANDPLYDADSSTAWADNAVQRIKRFRRFKQQFFAHNASSVPYNITTMPVAPKKYNAFVDPSTASIKVQEINIDKQSVKDDVAAREIKKIYWLHKFDGLVQFSQAYNSVNWYQGGSNNLTILGNAVYNVKLNQAFKPNILFDNTISYKVALNSAPDDSLRNYTIAEDLLQINSKFGLRAAKRWYYSATLMFKTQLLNNYAKNTNNLKAAFLAPGELNVGLGMTYEYKSGKGKFYFNTSLDPISYNMWICTDKRVNETAFGIKEGHTTVSQYGSKIDTKISWKIAYNISLDTHFYAFTNYSYLQADMENTLKLAINKYLSTQVYAHFRYDSRVPAVPGSKWRQIQCKEILSFGFAYTIGTV